eukprot:TRINITY_DN27395_c0_g1_i1.p1 TRINITY_DN27395_c0_g1~~TRINITY_DN27395_c0_g1_i1.p1  ORF type:complete len:506 (+),score=107.01 TRINITY_DN27395_c0_g1_i1:88-1605(+)
MCIRDRVLGCSAAGNLQPFFCTEVFQSVSPAGLPHSDDLFYDTTNSDAALAEIFPPIVSSTFSAIIRQVSMLGYVYNVHFFETNGRCGDALVAALLGEAAKHSTSGELEQQLRWASVNWTHADESSLREETLTSVRQGVVLVPARAAWDQGCQMRLACEKHYTGLPLKLLGMHRTNLIWMLHLPASVILALSAGFLTSNKQLRFGFGGVFGVAMLLALFMIILIKLTPSQMKSITKLCWGIGAISILAIKRQIYLLILPYVWQSGKPFPECVTLVGWSGILLVMMAFVIGAHKVEDWTRSAETQRMLKAVFLLLCYTSVALSLPDMYSSLLIVCVLFIKEYVLPSTHQVTVTWILLAPFLVVYYPIIAILRSIGAVGSGLGTPGIEEVFFAGRPLHDDAPAAPSPFKRGSRFSADETELRSMRSTTEELDKLYRAVAQADRCGVVPALPSWTVARDGSFVQEQPKPGCSLWQVSPSAKMHISKALQSHLGSAVDEFALFSDDEDL